MAFKSRLAFALVLTRKVMLLAQLFKHFLSRLGASGLHVVVAFADTLHRFMKVRALPCEILCERSIERGGGILPAPMGIFLKLSFAFGSDGYHVHVLMVEIAGGGVNLPFSSASRLSSFDLTAVLPLFQ